MKEPKEYVVDKVAQLNIIISENLYGRDECLLDREFNFFSTAII